MEGFTHITLASCDSNAADTLAIVCVASPVECSYRVTVAWFTSHTTGKVPESRLTLVTLKSYDMGLTLALSIQLVADWWAITLTHCTIWVASTWTTISLW